jgi:hypothetical protein
VGCWSVAGFTPMGNSQWSVNLQNGCAIAPMGVQTVGSLCFTAVSAQSAFVPFTISDLAVTNLDASLPPARAFGSRPVVIANEPLLEALVGPGGERLLTLYGKANTIYETSYTADLTTASAWTAGWTNTLPASMFYSQVLQGTLSNSPAVFLRANEQ